MIGRDRFSESLIPAENIAEITQISEDNRNIFPVFSDNDSLVLFTRLQAGEPEAAEGLPDEEILQSFALNIYTNELLSLKTKYDYPAPKFANYQKWPKLKDENIFRAVDSPDSNIWAYDTKRHRNDPRRIVYLMVNDTIRQLTYGETPCFLYNFSNTGRYLTAIYGKGPGWILIYDLKEDKMYRISHNKNEIDYMPQFSSDDRFMVFIRTNKQYTYDNEYFGEMHLVKFTN